MSYESVNRDGLNYDFFQLFDVEKAWQYFNALEDEITYLEGAFARVRVRGQWFPIPRQHVAFGDPGLTYTFSNVCIPAKPWTSLLLDIKKEVERVCQTEFNFVLINRYANGNMKIGAHQDDEKDLDRLAPIASVSLGAERDFVFERVGFPRKTLKLHNGSLLVMKHPTNQFYFHSLPPRKKVVQPRLNLTFRKIVCDSLPSSAIESEPSELKTMQSFKRMCESPETSAKRSKPCGFMLNQLPEHHFHLGDDLFITVSSFQGVSRVHIRKCKSDEANRLHFTKEGVAMTPLMWLDFLQKIKKLEKDQVVLAWNQLLVSYDGQQYFFQKLFRSRKKNFRLEKFCVCLSAPQYMCMLDLSEKIISALQKELLFDDLQRALKREVIKHITPQNFQNPGDPDRPDGVKELETSLCRHLKDSVVEKLKKHSDIENLEDRLELFFNEALFQVNLDELSKRIIDDCMDFVFLFSSYELSELFSFEKIIENVKELYLCDTPEFSFYTDLFNEM